jgi:arabinose-5-phosphate isomerase
MDNTEKLERDCAEDNLLAQSRSRLMLVDSIDDRFNEVVHEIESAWNCHCLIVFSGVGKSGLVGRYLASCFNAIGVSSAFLHPTDAVHGDMGILQGAGVLIALSVSGETKELEPILNRVGYLETPAYLITAGGDSCTLALNVQNVLPLARLPEIDPSGMVPLRASLMQMALGNALVVAVAERIGFNKNKLAVLHPGGSIGEKLQEEGAG